MSGLTSIVMPCCGQLEYTRLSVPRLIRHSRQPFEVLFVDAGSLDGTADFLAGVAAASPSRVEVVRAEGEDGFARSVKEALGRARGAFVAWVNNDVLLTESWLEQLVALVTAHDSLGLVGPTANLAPDPQRAEHVPYRLGRPGAGLAEATTGAGQLDTQAVDLFAREQRNALRNNTARRHLRLRGAGHR
jgi:GT2 family glycosyltransferase